MLHIPRLCSGPKINGLSAPTSCPRRASRIILVLYPGVHSTDPGYPGEVDAVCRSQTLSRCYNVAALAHSDNVTVCEKSCVSARSGRLICPVVVAQQTRNVPVTFAEGYN